MIESKRMRWAGHVPRMREERTPVEALVGKHKERVKLRRLDVDGITIIIKWILEKLIGEFRLDSSGWKKRQKAGSLSTVMNIQNP